MLCVSLVSPYLRLLFKFVALNCELEFESNYLMQRCFLSFNPFVCLHEHPFRQVFWRRYRMSNFQKFTIVFYLTNILYFGFVFVFAFVNWCFGVQIETISLTIDVYVHYKIKLSNYKFYKGDIVVYGCNCFHFEKI